MATPQERVVAKAKSQVGYIANWDKSNKFARQLDQLGVYNGPKNGFDWCDVFADWCFIDEFGVDVGMRMLNQPMHGGGAGCWLSAGYHRDAGQWSDSPQLGAQIYFGSYGDESHTGIVVAYDGSTVTTVEGNTGYSEGYGGGAVLMRTYSRDSSRIVGYGIPKWSLAGGSDEPIRPEVLDVDGDAGPKTIRAWQRQMGTDDDGILSGQLYSEDKFRRNVWAVDHNYEGSGSALVLAVQKRLARKGLYDGLHDGCWGYATTSAIQKQLKQWGYYKGRTDDGDFAHHSVQCLQRSINDGKWAE